MAFQENLSPDELERGEYVWVENLRSGPSVFRHSVGTFRMAPGGYVGAVIEVPARIARDPFFRRSKDRGHIKVLSETEAYQRMEDLEELPIDGDGIDRIEEAMADGAMDSLGNRYRRDVPDTGRESKEISSQEVWAKKRSGKDEPRTVRRSGNSEPVSEQGGDILEGPVLGKQVLTEKVKEGEWTPDTGE